MRPENPAWVINDLPMETSLLAMLPKVDITFVFTK